MSAQEVKPVTAEAGVVEPTPAPTETLTTEAAAAPAVEPKAEEPAKVEDKVEEAVAPAPAEETKEEKKEEKVEEPIYSGALGYKAPGLKNAFRFSKKYFWFGQEEPVAVSSLSHYLRGEKAEIAQPTAAWSSQTGKGLLYFVKHADEKATPAGVLNLSEATDLSKDGTVAFFFKLHGHKHTFEAATLKERNGWFVAFEQKIEEAKAAKEGVVSSEGYKEELSKLSKPAAPAAAAAALPKKSIDATPKAETEAAPVAETSAVAARNGSSSSSSSSSDEEKKKKKKATKSKSRSVSRGKRASLFGGLLGKKDKAEEKVEEKKEKAEEKAEEKKEEKKEGETPAAPAAETSTPTVAATAPVIPPVEETSAPATELKDADETVPFVPAAAPATEEKKPEEKKVEEKKVEEKPKPTKRSSIFGSFVEKLKSPTHEKKEHEVAPPVPAKEAEPVSAEAPKIEEPAKAEEPTAAPATTEPLAPVLVPEVPKTEEVKPAGATPRKEKQHFSFGKFLGNAKEKVRSPSTEKAPEAPKTEEPAKAEAPTAAPATTEPLTPAVAPVEPAAEAPKEGAPKQENTTPAKKRGSVFGSLFRNASKAGKTPKKEEAPAVPTKAEETTEVKDTKTEEPAKVEETSAAAPTAPATTEPAAIGDVVPEAVTVGQDSKSTPQVPATA